MVSNEYYFLMLCRFVAHVNGVQFSTHQRLVSTDWFHLTLAYTSMNLSSDFSLFINGNQLTTQIVTTYYGTTLDSTTDKIRIGWAGAEHDFIYGSVIVDEVAMWNRALNANEVKAVYDMY